MSVWKLAFEFEVPDGLKPHWALGAASDAVDDVGFRVKGESASIERVFPPLKVVPNKVGGKEK